MVDIYVINLDSRTDRWNKICESFGKYFNLIRISAIKHNEGWRGCLLSHKKCIQYAKDNNMKNIIVMEDDCEPISEEKINEFLKIKEDILDKRNDFDIYLGASTKTWIKGFDTYDYQNVYNIHRAFATLFICYNHSSYDYFLNCDNETPIDACWHRNIKCIMSVPFLFTTYNDFSDVENKMTTVKNTMIKNESKLLEHIKNNLNK